MDTEERNACKTFNQMFFIKGKQQTTEVQGDTWACAVRLRGHGGVGRGQRALKAGQGLPNCAPRPVTEHRIQHFVYFSQLSAHKKGLDATRPSGHWKQADKIRPRQTFLSPPALLQHRFAKNKAQRRAALLQRASTEVTRLIGELPRGSSQADASSERRGESLRKSTTPLISSDLSIVRTVVGFFFPPSSISLRKVSADSLRQR